MRSRWRSATSSPRRASARSSRATTGASRRETASSASSAGRSTQSHAAARSASCRRCSSRRRLRLHAVGATGMTAYFGLFDVGKPRPGDTVVVSCAAGAVGQIVGQLAKLAGCRTVGIAGGPDEGARSARALRLRRRDRLQGRRRLGGVARGACRRVLRQRRRRDLAGGASPAERRRTHRDLRSDLAVQRGAPGTDVPSRPPDRVSRADGGLPHQRLRTPVRRGRDATGALGRERRAAGGGRTSPKGSRTRRAPSSAC